MLMQMLINLVTCVKGQLCPVKLQFKHSVPSMTKNICLLIGKESSQCTSFAMKRSLLYTSVLERSTSVSRVTHPCATTGLRPDENRRDLRLFSEGRSYKIVQRPAKVAQNRLKYAKFILT